MEEKLTDQEIEQAVGDYFTALDKWVVDQKRVQWLQGFLCGMMVTILAVMLVVA